MNIYEIFVAGREKTISVEGDRVEVTRDFLKVFKGTHEVAFFTAAHIDGCTVAHGTNPIEATKSETTTPVVAGP
jgi:hypothetical protein